MRNIKGEGSFLKNSNGTYTHRKSVGYKLDGKRKILTVTASSKAACIREMKIKETEWSMARNNGNGHDYSLVELCQAHLDYQATALELKPKSIDRRECSIDNHIGKYPIADKRINDIGVADIDDFIGLLISERRLSASSIYKVLDIINAAYDWGMLRKFALTNPVAPVKATLRKRIAKMQSKSADDSDVRVMSDEEEKLFVKEALRINQSGSYQYPAGLYLVLLLYTGMRVGEMLALTWNDVDVENGYITISKCSTMAKSRDLSAKRKYIATLGTTKNEKARRIKLSDDALEILKVLRQDKRENSLVCTTLTGNINTATNLEHRMQVICHNAGLVGVSGLHTFRRTFATRLYAKGARTKEIAAYIGDLASTTERYYIGVRKKEYIRDGIVEVVPLPVNKNN